MPTPDAPPVTALAARADARPRRTTGGLVAIALVLLAVAVLLRGWWAGIGVPLAVLVLAIAYGLALRRVWAGALGQRL